MLQIETSEDWQQIDQELQNSIKNLPFHIRKDLDRINKNICACVSELSKTEIECRRQHKPTQRFLETRDKCNEMITDYQKMIMMGQLL
jgi:hypothetical protein